MNKAQRNFAGRLQEKRKSLENRLPHPVYMEVSDVTSQGTILLVKNYPLDYVLHTKIEAP